jgi:hypothetical protein
VTTYGAPEHKLYGLENVPMEEPYRQTAILSQQFDNDPKKLMQEALDRAQDPSRGEPGQALQALLHSQQLLREQKIDPGSVARDYAKASEDWLKGVGSFWQGAWNLLQHPTDLGEDIGSAIDQASKVAHFDKSRANYLVDALTSHRITRDQYDQVNQQIKAGLQTGTQPALLPGEQAEILAQGDPVELGRIKRQILAGTVAGGYQNLSFVESLVNNTLGLARDIEGNPITNVSGGLLGRGLGKWLRSPLDPNKQQFWLSQGVPILSPKPLEKMTAPELYSEFQTRNFINNVQRQARAGYLPGPAESLLNAWEGGKAYTPEEQIALGKPVKSDQIEHVANATNLGLSSLELGALGPLTDALGLSSAIDLASGYALRGGANTIRDFQTTTTGPLEWASKTGLVWTKDWLARHPGTVGVTTMGITKPVIELLTGTHIPINWETAFVGNIIKTPLGKILNGPIGWGIDLARRGAGFTSKAVSLFTDPLADALETAAQDTLNHTDLLSTRTPLVNVLGTGAKYVTHDLLRNYPLVRAITDDPAQQGQIMAYGLLGSLFGSAPEISDTARNLVGDWITVRDTERSRAGKSDAAPFDYGVRPDLDRMSRAAINELYPDGTPVHSDATKQTYHNTRATFWPGMEIHALRPPDYKAELDRMNNYGVVQNPDLNSRGIAIDPHPDLVNPRILIRSDHLNEALFHEISHPFVNRMTPGQLDSIFNLAVGRTDPNEFTLRYTRGAADYDHLPEEEPRVEPLKPGEPPIIAPARPGEVGRVTVPGYEGHPKGNGHRGHEQPVPRRFGREFYQRSDRAPASQDDLGKYC